MENVSIYKDALEYSAQQAKPIVVEVGRSKFALWPEGTVEELIPAPRSPRPDTLPLSSLEALVTLVKTEAVPRLMKSQDVRERTVYITVPSFGTVRVFSNPDMADEGFRPVLYEAEAVDIPGWSNDAQLGFEQAQIALRTRFQHTEDADYCLMLLSQISMGAKVTYSDNGVATSVVTQKGVALQDNQLIRPLVRLRPYRTFQEVDQPASEFHIRIGEKGIRFIESDGGMWKLDARRTVRDYLREALRDEVESKAVYVSL